MFALLSRFFPWRSPRFALVCLAIALVFAVPLFLRMPPWCDLTLYAVAADNLLHGGVHYRDVLDTNLPGFVWLLSLIRLVLGRSWEAVRLVDLGIVGGIAIVLDRFMRDGGGSRASRFWTMAAFAQFYLATTEACHGQRDVWMLLPALAAVRYRFLFHAREGDVRPVEAFRAGLGQGALWGIAVWIKPHAIIPAAIVWLGTVFIARHRRGWHGWLADFAGNFLGGAVVGAFGVGLLVAGGSWPYFIEVLTVWNPAYVEDNFRAGDLVRRIKWQDGYFPPWSYLHWAAIPAAALAVLDGYTGLLSRWIPRVLWPRAERPARIARLFVAGLYLAWTLQALVIQRPFHYVHVPEILLLLAVLGSQRWAVAFLTIFFQLAMSGAIALDQFDNNEQAWPGVMIGHDPDVSSRHPITKPEEWRMWPQCFRFGLSPAEERQRLWDLSRVNGFDPAPKWPELGEIADELARRGAKDRDVIAWNDAPHALYLMLDIRPGLRFLHVRTFQNINDDREAAVEAEAEHAARHARYAVADLRCLWIHDQERPPPLPTLKHGEGAMVVVSPPGLDIGRGTTFPYEYEPIFRSGHGAGRYILYDLRAKQR